MADDFRIKGPAQRVGADVARTLPRIGGPAPGDAVSGIPHLGPREPSPPASKEGSPDKRRPDKGSRSSV